MAYRKQGSRPSTTRSNYSFSEVPSVQKPRSTFKQNHGHKLTGDAGYLIPILNREVLPGDTFRVVPTLFARLATQIYPVMDNMWFTIYFFFVPNRVIDENWVGIQGQKENPGDDTSSLATPVVTVPSGGFAEGSLYDYLGVPPGVDHEVVVNYPARAYNLIFNEFFRAEQILDSATVDKDAGPDTDTDYVLRRRMKRADYFTRALPSPQLGDAVELPLGSTAPVTITSTGDGIPLFDVDTTGRFLKSTTEDTGNDVHWNTTIDANHTATWDDPKLAGTADLSSATAATVSDVRLAFQTQRVLERDSRAGGLRYQELMMSHFGVRPSDSRLQRPEYLGGGIFPINVSPVAQSSGYGEVGGPHELLGELAAFATAGSSGKGFVKSFTEHGTILGLVQLTADLTYQEGLHKSWTRRTRFEYYMPAFAHLSEQPVYASEIVANGSNQTTVFGYQERWAEYKHAPSQVSGAFRSTAATPLDAWHLALDFEGTPPTLNQAFIEDDPPFDRIIATPSEPHFIMDCYFEMNVARVMPTFSVPGLIDHF